MNLTAYHAKYFAYELTRRYSSNSLQKFTASLADAQVDLNPHQVDAALFAFRSPLSQGAVLADEVGLGKTIEAGIVLAQRWAERNRKILIILPSSLRKQWHQELQDKFYLPSEILESENFNKAVKDGKHNPLTAKKLSSAPITLQGTNLSSSGLSSGILLLLMRLTGLGMCIKPAIR